eukprot:gene10933-12094_t
MAKLIKVGQRVILATPSFFIRLTSKGADAYTKVQPHMSDFWSKAKVEMAPPGPSEIPAIRKGIIQMKENLLHGKFLDASVKETAAKGLVAAEVCFWFFVGEMIGRKSVIGYDV